MRRERTGQPVAIADRPEVTITPAPDSGSARPARRMRRLVRRHAVFGVLALLGAVGRILVLVAYPPALMYLGDSGAYLDQAWRGLWPGDWRPSGYPIFLRLLDGPEHITRVVIVQHVLTLVVAGGLYAVAVRAVRRPWLAALAATPALLAPWILDLGQFVLADSLFGVLTTAGVALLAWPNRAGPRAAALAGLLLGAALCVRTVGYGPLAVALVTLIVDAARRSPRPWRADISGRNLSGADLPAPTVTGADMPRVDVSRVDVPRTGVSRTGMRQRAWRRVRVRRVRVRRVAPVMAFVVGAAMPVGAYAGWSAAAGEGFAVSAHSGFFLYGRVAPFADCADVTAAGLRSLCDPRPVGQRGAPVRYLWPADSPLRQGHRHIPPGREELAGRFAHEVVRQQPWMLVTSSARYLAGYFSPVPYETAKTSRADTWELPTDRSNALPPSDPHADDGYFVATAVRGPSGLLAEWSRVSYPLMPMVGLGLLAGLTAAVIAAVRALRARRSPRQADGTGVSNVAVDATPEAEAEVGPGADAGLGRGTEVGVGPGTGVRRGGEAGVVAEGDTAAERAPGEVWRVLWLAGGAGGSTLVLSAVTSGFDYRYLGGVIGLVGLAAMMGAVAFVRVVSRRPAG